MLEGIRKVFSKLQLTERQAAAEKIKKLREGEQKNSRFYNKTRDMAGYINMLGGIKIFLDYAKKLDSNLVLDIGAGDTIATKQIAESEMGKGLKFEATVLTRNKNTSENLGEENTHTTSAEVLRGIKDNSVGAIISVYALPYVASPGLVVESIKRVLIDGGIVKIQLASSDLKSNIRKKEGRNILGYDLFVEEFKQNGFDVAVDDDRQCPVLVAIKPGGKLSMTANELLKE